MKQLLTAMAVCGALSCAAADASSKETWSDDFSAAQAKSKELGRPILADFSGSDWCGWCMKLEREVFSQQDFKTYASENLVLFLADYPRGKQLPAKVVKQNAALQTKYGIEGYPTVLLLDADGKVLGQTGYQAGGPETYVQHLKDLLAQAGWKPPEKPAATTNAPAYKPAMKYTMKKKQPPTQ